MPPLGRRDAGLLALILAAAAAAYARVLHGEFVFDDFSSIVTRAETKDLAAYAREAFAAAIARGGTSRPVTDLTFALNYRWSGFDTLSFHAVNLGVHLAAVLLIFAFTRETLRRAGWPGAGVPLAVAAAFALHPMQSEAVSYLAQRSESLASALYVTSLLLLLRAEGRLRTPAGALLYAAATLAFVAGLGAKLVVVTAPVAYLAHRVWFPGPGAARPSRRELGWSVARVLPWAAIAALSTAATLRGLAQPAAPCRSPSAGFSVAGLGARTYALTQTRVVLGYLRLLLLPVGQNADPDVPLAAAWTEPAVLASAAVIAALAASAAAMLRSASRTRGGGDAVAAKRVASYGIAWFFLLLAPTSTVVPIADVMAEHRVYLASWGVYAAVAIGAAVAIRRLVPPARATALAGVAAWSVAGGLAAALHARNAVWESAVALWSDVSTRSPAKARGWGALGNALLARGDRRAAAAALDRALVLRPGDPVFLHTSAVLRLDEGRLDEAEALAREAIAVAPAMGEAYNTLGEIALQRGDASRALPLFEASVALGGAGVPPRLYNVAVALEAVGREPEACAAWARYLGAEGDRAARDEARAHAVARGCALP